jgi:hypothetical protein
LITGNKCKLQIDSGTVEEAIVRNMLQPG